MEWEIMEADPEDAPLVADAVGSLLEAIMAASGQRHFHFDREDTIARVGDWLRRGVYQTLLARSGGQREPLGLISVTEAHALYTGGPFGLIPEFYVRPECRSQGIGRALLAGIRHVGRDRGWGRLEVTTPPLPAFERTFMFYEAQGFRISGGHKMKLEL